MYNKFFALLFFLCLSLVSLSANAKTFLVSVGIGDYPGSVNDLRLPAKDAEDVVELFRINGGYDNLETFTLFDKDATRKSILNAMKSLFSKATPDDNIILFFSGHGYPGGFNAYDEKLPYEEVRRAMASSRSLNKIIFADACYSGKIRTQKPASDSDAQNANVMLFLSSRSNETSIERGYMKNGIFTTYLLRALRGEADANKDRIVSARELFDFVHAGVIKRSNKKQHPVMWGKFSSSMPIIKW
ncbi:MAG: caspase family protein [Clostridium sp.]|nr:caspase family protein [Prevotella sp.]MCM1428663.1 caspase family protein [Clostridium sp.]